MAGYIGSKARQRRRNFFLLLLVLLLLFLILIFFAQIDFNETNLEPEYDILPKPDEEISSLSSKVEDLNLTIFQKDQKIKFRDRQINNLKKEISDLKINYEKIQSDHSRHLHRSLQGMTAMSSKKHQFIKLTVLSKGISL